MSETKHTFDSEMYEKGLEQPAEEAKIEPKEKDRPLTPDESEILGTLYERWSKYLRTVIGRHVNHLAEKYDYRPANLKELEEDLLHQAFLNYIRHPNQFPDQEKFNERQLKTYLVINTKNVVSKYFSQYAARPFNSPRHALIREKEYTEFPESLPVDDGDVYPIDPEILKKISVPAEQTTEQRLNRDGLEKIINGATLTKREEEIIKAFLYDDKDFLEIALRYDVKASRIEQIFRKIAVKLRKSAQNLGIHSEHFKDIAKKLEDFKSKNVYAPTEREEI